MKKNNLDERQEQTLLRIEHNGCWLSFWGLMIAAGVVAVFDFLLIYSKYSDKPIGSLASGVFAGGATFILCFTILQIAMVFYRKKQQKSEEEPEE